MRLLTLKSEKSCGLSFFSLPSFSWRQPLRGARGAPSALVIAVDEAEGQTLLNKPQLLPPLGYKLGFSSTCFSDQFKVSS